MQAFNFLLKYELQQSSQRENDYVPSNIPGCVDEVQVSRIQVYGDFLTSNSVNIGIKPPNPWLSHIIFCLIMKIY